MGPDADKATQQRMKGEIVARIGELQRIKELQQRK
jgi:hypothetical protein